MSIKTPDFEEPEQLGTPAICDPDDSPENLVLRDGFGKINAFGAQHDKLTTLVEVASQRPSEPLFLAIEQQSAKAKQGSAVLMQDRLFANSGDEILIKAAIAKMIDLTAQASDLANRIFPQSSTVTYDAVAKQRVYHDLTTETDEEGYAFAIATEIHSDYESAIENLLEALDNSDNVAGYFAEKERKMDVKDELRDRLLNVGGTAVAIAFGLTLYDLAKKVKNRRA